MVLCRKLAWQIEEQYEDLKDLAKLINGCSDNVTLVDLGGGRGMELFKEKAGSLITISNLHMSFQLAPVVFFMCFLIAIFCHCDDEERVPPPPDAKAVEADSKAK